MEEELMIQLQALQFPSEVQENTDELDDFVRCQAEPSYSDTLKVKNQHLVETVPENTVSSSNQKVKTYSCGGARPKISQVIDRFGGWGLKNESKGENSENLTNFVDEIVSEKAPKKIDKQKSDYKSKYVTEQKSNVKDPWETTDAKENEYSKSSWGSPDTKNLKKPKVNEESWSDGEHFYNEKQTFVDDDDDDNWNSQETEKKNVTLTNVSPNKVLDSWLSSDDIHDNTLNNMEELIAGASINCTSPVSSKDNLSNGDLKDKNTSDSASVYVTNVSSNSELKDSLEMNNSSDLSQKSHEYLSIKSDLIDDISSFDESLKIPSLSNKDIWSDKLSDNSSFFSSFPDSQNLSNKSEDAKFSSGNDCEDFNVAISSDADLPPILPPKTPPLANEANIAAGMSDAESVLEPSILPPQPAPEVPIVPQFPMMSNPLFNPMLPGINPMLGFGMNSLMARQMLMLTNPFLASQILAMEQQYRAMGMPVDFFSVPTPMPNVSIPGMAYPSMMQNVTCANVSSDVPQSQNQPDNYQFSSGSENHISNPKEKLLENSNQASELKAFSGIDSSSSVENGADDSWYKSYLSNDNSAGIPPPQPAVIPPPKSPTYAVNNNYLEHVSEPSGFDQSASKFNNIGVGRASVPDNLDSRLPVKMKESQRLPSAVEACMTKTVVTGWSDSEDDSSNVHKCKTTSWDDGWGDNAVPAKPLRNASLYDDKKRTVLRQPARQPQISRYQRNKTHN